MTEKVIIYTQETCGPCHAEKEWLTSHNISFEDRDIRKNGAYMQEVVDLGASATPVTVVELDGKREVVMGFDREKLANILGLE
ncbi:glutaredoxin family protein [Ectobacillus sp. JY-23]|uniref:glutaredoxin domain-containing protein n=1 Tax=Ectobacillus sp. JY-23 TaxID=2933872 RepID=UPI001FF66F64|nr:glutaredoxin domain-containing protein [Ectobacillus sp. JY-23]UOY93000.1 glutaredoxin family protein [Ectobacillus sp. JY-23]